MELVVQTVSTLRQKSVSTLNTISKSVSTVSQSVQSISTSQEVIKYRQYCQSAVSTLSKYSTAQHSQLPDKREAPGSRSVYMQFQSLYD